MAGPNNKAGGPQTERRATRSTTKAPSTSPTEGIESPQPRRKRGLTPEVAGTPSQITPAKVRTRRASLADTPQEATGTPMRRSRRLSTNSEDVATPSKTRTIRGVRANLALAEHPVPEEEEIKRTSPTNLRRRKDTEQNKIVENPKEKTTENGSDPTRTPSPKTSDKETENKETPKRKVGRPRKVDNQNTNTSIEPIRSSVVKLRKVSSELGEVAVSPVKRRTRKTVEEGKQTVLNNKPGKNNGTENINNLEAPGSSGERMLEPKNEVSKSMNPLDDVIVILDDDDEEEQAALPTAEDTPKVIKCETMKELQKERKNPHENVTSIETEEKIVSESSESKSSQVERRDQVDTTSSTKPAVSETDTMEPTSDAISVETPNDHVKSKLTEKSESISDKTNEPHQHNADSRRSSTNSKKGSDFISNVSANTTKTDEKKRKIMKELQKERKNPHENVTSIETEEKIVTESSESKSSQVERRDQVDTTRSSKPAVSETDTMESTSDAISVETPNDHVKSKLTEKSESISDTTNEPHLHNEDSRRLSTNSKKGSDFISDVSANTTKTDEPLEPSVIDFETASKKSKYSSANNSLEVSDAHESVSEVLEISKIENEDESSNSAVNKRVSDIDVEINETIVEATEVGADLLNPALMTCETTPKVDKSDIQMSTTSQEAADVGMKSMDVVEETHESESQIAVVAGSLSGMNEEESNSIVRMSKNTTDARTPDAESCSSKDPVPVKEAPQSLTEDPNPVEQTSDVSSQESKLISKAYLSRNELLTPEKDKNKDPDAKIQPEENIKIDAPAEQMEGIEENEDCFSSPGDHKKMSFAKSWNQSVKGPTTKSPEEPEFIDAISLRTSINNENSSLVSVEISPEPNAAKQLNETPSMNEEDCDDDKSDSEASRNEFIDDEAMEVSEDERSMNSSERAYLEENEVPVKGESIGSEDTFDELEEEEEDYDEDEEMGSFIVSESELDKLSGNDSLLGSDDEKIVRKKKFRRLIQNSNSSEESEKSFSDTEEGRDKSNSPKFSSDEDSDEDIQTKNHSLTAAVNDEETEKGGKKPCNPRQNVSEIKSSNKIESARHSVDKAKSSDVIIGSKENEPETKKNVDVSTTNSNINKLEDFELQANNEKTDNEVVGRCPKTIFQITEKIVEENSSPKISTIAGGKPQYETKHDLIESSHSPKKRLSEIKPSHIAMSPKSRRCGTIVSYEEDCRMNANSMKTVAVNITEPDNQESSSSENSDLKQPTISRNVSMQKAKKLKESNNLKKLSKEYDSESDHLSEDASVNQYKRISLPSTRAARNGIEKKKRYSLGQTSADKRKASLTDTSKASKISLIRRKCDVSKKSSSSENDSSSDSDIVSSKLKSIERVNKSTESNLVVEYSTDSSDTDLKADKSAKRFTHEKNTEVLRTNSDDTSKKIENSSYTVASLETTCQDISHHDSNSNVANINITKEEHNVNDKVMHQVLPADGESKCFKNKRSSITKKCKNTLESSEASDADNDICSTVEISKIDSYLTGKLSMNNAVKSDRSTLQQSLNQSSQKVQDAKSGSQDESESSENTINMKDFQENKEIKQSITSGVEGKKSNSMNNSLHKMSMNRSSLSKNCGSSSDSSEDDSGETSYKLNLSNKVVGKRYSNSSASIEHNSDKNNESKTFPDSRKSFTPRKCLNESNQSKESIHQKPDKSEQSESTSESEDEIDSIVKVGNISRELYSSKLKISSKSTKNSPVKKSVIASVALETNETNSLNTTNSPQKKTSLSTSFGKNPNLGKKHAEERYEDLKASAATKLDKSPSIHTHINANLDNTSSDSSDDTSNNNLRKCLTIAKNNAGANTKLSKSQTNAKQNDKVITNVASKSDSEIFVDGSRKMDIIKDLKKELAKEEKNPKENILPDVVSIMTKATKQKDPLLDESMNKDLDKIIMVAKKKVHTSDDNKIVMKTISKLVSKSLKNLSKLDMLDDETHKLREQHVDKKKLRKKRQKMKKPQSNRGVDSKDDSSSTSESRAQNNASIPKERKVMDSNKSQDSKCDTINDTENSQPDGLLFKSLKEINQSTPANRENIVVNRKDVNYKSTTEQTSVTDGKYTLPNDGKLSASAGKKETASGNRSASEQNSKFSKKVAAFVDVVAHSSSDNSFENYHPQSKCGSKEKLLLKTKPGPNNKKKKFGQESEVLKELIINSIESKKEKIKKKDKQNVQGNSNAQEIVSAFEAYNRNKKKQDQYTDGSSLLKNKRKREIDDASVSASSSSDNKTITSVNSSGSRHSNDWQITDLPKKKRENIIANLPFGFEERAATPKKVNGFEVNPLTPKHHDWKVTSHHANVNECSGKLLKEKKIKHKASSREKVWTSVGYFEVTDADHVVQRKKHSRSFTTDFEVQALKRRKY